MMSFISTKTERAHTSVGIPFTIAFGAAVMVSTAMGPVLPAYAWTPTSSGESAQTHDEATSFTSLFSSLSVPASLIGLSTAQSAAQQISSLRSLSGLTTDQIARLMGVSRRSIHNWINGSSMALNHAERASRLLAVIRALPGQSPEERKAVLLDSHSGQSMFHKLLTEQSHDARIQVPAVGVRDRIAL